MPTVVNPDPDPSVAKKIACSNCGATIQYVPNDIRTLWSGTDYGGGPDGAKGFACPNCSKNIVTERW
jgi:hypothetical protein